MVSEMVRVFEARKKELESVRDEIREAQEKRVEFANDFLKDHTFINSRSLAIAYNNSHRTERPSPKQVHEFAQILGKFREKGVIEKYNNRQFKKVGGV